MPRSPLAATRKPGNAWPTSSRNEAQVPRTPRNGAGPPRAHNEEGEGYTAGRTERPTNTLSSNWIADELFIFFQNRDERSATRKSSSTVHFGLATSPFGLATSLFGLATSLFGTSTNFLCHATFVEDFSNFFRTCDDVQPIQNVRRHPTSRTALRVRRRQAWGDPGERPGDERGKPRPSARPGGKPAQVAHPSRTGARGRASRRRSAGQPLKGLDQSTGQPLR